ncbi:hypothetical protein DA2_2738 [Desulfovibrio sp. A2]|nr:hypothetical protein DA2_2738 [Desulfovibrio sp. A2]
MRIHVFGKRWVAGACARSTEKARLPAKKPGYRAAAGGNETAREAT